MFRSKSSQADSDSPRGACKGYIFALEVAEELHQWPEQDTHGRQWVSQPRSMLPSPERELRVTMLLFLAWHQVSPDDAYRLCRYEWMREALSALLERLPAICHCQPATTTTNPATPELNERAAGMYMMMKPAATAEPAVALC